MSWIWNPIREHHRNHNQRSNSRKRGREEGPKNHSQIPLHQPQILPLPRRRHLLLFLPPMNLLLRTYLLSYHKRKFLLPLSVLEEGKAKLVQLKWRSILPTIIEILPRTPILTITTIKLVPLAII